MKQFHAGTPLTAPPGLDDWGPRTFDTVALGQHYRLTLPQLGLIFDLDRLRRDKGDLRGYLTVRSGMAGARTINGVLFSGSFFPASGNQRKQYADIIETRALAKDIDFFGLLEELSLRAEQAERMGVPPVRMRDVPLQASTEDRVHEVYGLRLAKHHPSMLYGLGDSLKSYLTAVVLGELELRGVRTLLVDWEMTAEDHRARLASLYGTTIPNFTYQRAERPLVSEIDRLVQLVHDEGIQYVAFDSVGFGCAGPPESAEEALAFMRAVRRLNVGTLLLAHQAKGEGGDKTPFGSAFWFNSCRVIYNVKREDAQADNGTVQIAAYPTKCNLSGPIKSVGFEFIFDGADVTVKQRDVADMASELAGKLSIGQRIYALLKAGPKTTAELAEAIGKAENSVSVALHRAMKGPKAWVVKVTGPNNTPRFGLMAKVTE